ncbi:hypothetical protein BDP67DRAFT_521765 [Colletotrichum lupini]|nr:hypothetical protein BDP67DRAFT_521765 [Colletotrichum lupini]
MLGVCRQSLALTGPGSQTLCKRRSRNPSLAAYGRYGVPPRKSEPSSWQTEEVHC